MLCGNYVTQFVDLKRNNRRVGRHGINGHSFFSGSIRYEVKEMLTADQRSSIINTFHAFSMLNFSSVLENISQSEFFVMAAVEKLSSYGDNNLGKVSSIAKNLHVSSPAISRTLTSLENKGYVVRCIDINNRRNTGVMLTEEGHDVLAKEYEKVNDVFGEVIDSMGEEKIDLLISLTKEMMDSFSNALTRIRS